MGALGKDGPETLRPAHRLRGDFSGETVVAVCPGPFLPGPTIPFPLSPVKDTAKEKQVSPRACASKPILPVVRPFRPGLAEENQERGRPCYKENAVIRILMRKSSSLTPTPDPPWRRARKTKTAPAWRPERFGESRRWSAGWRNYGDVISCLSWRALLWRRRAFPRWRPGRRPSGPPGRGRASSSRRPGPACGRT